MTIDNSTFVLRSRKYMYMMTISFFILVVFFMVFDNLDLPFKISYKEYYIIVLVSIYIIFHIRRLILDFNFISISDENSRLTIKFYSLMFLTSKHKTIVVPFQSLEKYKIETSVFGVKTKLILFQRLQGKVAKYPPISLTALSKTDIQKLTAKLEALTTRK